MTLNEFCRPGLRDMRRLVSPQTPDTDAVAPALAARDAESMADRKGYAADFLADLAVALPMPVGARAEDVTPTPERDGGRLDYTHFSIVMSCSRRLAIFTALNLDGGKLISVPREDDNWRYDPRLDESLQVGESLYSRNPLDRGHLVRRTSANWGE